MENAETLIQGIGGQLSDERDKQGICCKALGILLEVYFEKEINLLFLTV